ncbi:MAG TPA: hypothetical protein VFT98_00060, partial [Myxococcota bacterium]|nr:hypothetical protein [Myxococcota bacterium]
PVSDAADALAAAICRAQRSGAIARAQGASQTGDVSVSEARRLWEASVSRRRARPAQFVLRGAR